MLWLRQLVNHLVWQPKNKIKTRKRRLHLVVIKEVSQMLKLLHKIRVIVLPISREPKKGLSKILLKK
jgi:hypothetical protein